jgi:hypothetical protein
VCGESCREVALEVPFMRPATNGLLYLLNYGACDAKRSHTLLCQCSVPVRGACTQASVHSKQSSILIMVVFMYTVVLSVLGLFHHARTLLSVSSSSGRSAMLSGRFDDTQYLQMFLWLQI